MDDPGFRSYATGAWHALLATLLARRLLVPSRKPDQRKAFIGILQTDDSGAPGAAAPCHGLSMPG
jgi:hypothetical protein